VTETSDTLINDIVEMAITARLVAPIALCCFKDCMFDS